MVSLIEQALVYGRIIHDRSLSYIEGNGSDTFTYILLVFSSFKMYHVPIVSFCLVLKDFFATSYWTLCKPTNILWSTSCFETELYYSILGRIASLLWNWLFFMVSLICVWLKNACTWKQVPVDTCNINSCKFMLSTVYFSFVQVS